MKLDDIYHLEYLDDCLHLYFYTHNISDNMYFGLLQVFHVELGSLQLNLKTEPFI